MKLKFRYTNDTAMAQFGCLMILIIVSAIINGVAFPYTINSWLIYFGKEPVVLWWQGVLLGLVPGIGHLSIIFAVITWILMLFL